MLGKIDLNLEEWTDLEEDVSRDRQPKISIKKGGEVVFNSGIRELLEIDIDHLPHNRFEFIGCRSKERELVFLLKPSTGGGDTRRLLKLQKKTGSKNEKLGSFTLKKVLTTNGLLPLPKEPSNKGDGQEWTSINFTEGNGLYVDQSNKEQTIIQLKFSEGEGGVNKPVGKK